jgi:DNA-binding beta-propeller fold protein YncE
VCRSRARVADTISVGPNGQTNAITYAFYSVWVSTDSGNYGGTIVRLDPDTGSKIAEISVSAAPT